MAAYKYVKPRERKVVKCLWCLFSEINSPPPVNNNLFLSDYINTACCNQYPPCMNTLLGTGSDCNICYSTLQFSFNWIKTFICNSSIDFVPTSFLKMEEDWATGVLTLLFQLQMNIYKDSRKIYIFFHVRITKFYFLISLKQL